MGILPFGFDKETAMILGEVLHAAGYQVFVCNETESFSRTLHMRGRSIDVVVLFLSTKNRFCSAEIEMVTRCRNVSGTKPMLLCVPDRYYGARFELDLERTGARVAYIS